MKFIFVLLIYILCVKCSVPLTEIFEQDKTDIPTEIIGNYLHKYLSGKDVFLSIVLSSSTDAQHSFQQDIVSNLVTHTKLDSFSFNILKRLDRLRRGNTDVFNLILIDGSESLMWVLFALQTLRCVISSLFLLFAKKAKNSYQFI